MDRVRIVELLDARGRVLARVRPPGREFVVGRALSCGVVVDDPHVDAKHLRITTPATTDGTYELEDLGSVNGTQVGGRRLSPRVPSEIAPGEVIRVGDTSLRIVEPDEETGATRQRERRIFPRLAPGPVVALGLGLLVTVLSVLAMHLTWYDSDFALVALGATIGFPLFLLIWAAMWAVGNRLFVGRFRFWSHLAIASLTTLALSVGSVVASFVGFAMPGWFSDWIVGIPLALGPIFGGLLAHIDVSSGRPVRFKLGVAAAITAVVASIAAVGALALPSTQAISSALGAIEPLPAGLVVKQATEEFAQDLEGLEESLVVENEEFERIPTGAAPVR